MKRSLLGNLKPIAMVAVGIILGRGAQADTVLTFDGLPAGQPGGGQIIQSFGGNASASSPGVLVNGAGTPDIGLTWQGTGGRWDYYIDAVWSAGQLDSSDTGDLHEIIFTPTASKSVILKSFNFHPYYNNGLDYEYDWKVLDGTTVLTNGTSAFLSDATKTHPVNINYQGAPGQVLKLQIESTGGTDGPQNIAVDDITLAQLFSGIPATGMAAAR